METNTTTKPRPSFPRAGGAGPRGPRTGGGATGARGPRTGGAGGRGGDRRGPRGGSFERPRPEFEQKMLNIRRVTRVVSGGRRMSFAVAMVIGDKKGSVGLGTGKAGDTALAINKALRSAKKNMITLKLNKELSLTHDVRAKYGSAEVMIMPNRGKGLVAGSAVRDILHLAGVKNVTSKVLSSSKNKLNIARVTMQALGTIATKKGRTPVSEESAKQA